MAAYIPPEGDLSALGAAADRRDTSAQVAADTSLAEAARSRAAQQAEVPALKPQSNIAALGINQLPQEQQVRFYQLVEKAVQSAQQYAQTRGRAGESASTGGDLDDFVTEYFAKNTFPKIDETRAGGNVSAFVRRGGVQAAQAFFTKQGKFAAPGVFDETQDAAGRELAPQDAILAPGSDPEDEQRKAARRQQQQLAQVTQALGGKLPENHAEMVEAAKALGVSAKVAHTASGAGTNSAGNITNVLAAAVREQVGAVTTTQLVNQLASGGVSADNVTALSEGREAPLAALAGGGGRPPRRPIAPPAAGGGDGLRDPFEDYRARNPDEAAYQDSVLARLDEQQVQRELAKARRFEREASQTQADQMGAVRVRRRQNATNTDPLSVSVGDRYPAGSPEREQEAFQLAQLAAARARYGDQYGVPGDELAENRRQGRAEAIRDIHNDQYEQGRRAENAAFVDPLVVARDTRRQRYDETQNAAVQAEVERQRRADEQSRAQRAVGQRANAAGSRPGNFTTVGDRALARRARDIDGETDPVALKAQALASIAGGANPQEVLENVRDTLSPAQYAQVVHAARGQGFGRPTAMVVPNTGNAVSLFGQVPVTDPYSGAAQVGPDGKPVTRNVGLLAEQAKALANQRTQERGGAANLSDSTLAVVEAQALAEQENAVRRELISAQENLLKLLQPNMAALERQTKAIEDAEKALSGQTKVVKDQNGKLLGTEEQVSRATVRGVQAPGAGGFVYGLQQRFGGYIDSAREFARNNMATRLNARLAGFTNSPAFGYAAAGIGAAGAYASNYLDRSAGTAEEAIASTGAASTFRRNRGASGALSLGLAGAAGGFAVGGPVGAAVGAIAGVGYGLYSALQDAEKDIREAKIGNALTELSAKLSSFATGLPDGGTTGGIGALLDTYDREASERAREGATSFFGGFNASDYAQLRNKDLRKEFGPLLPNIGQGLTTQASRAGRDNPTADAAGVDGILTSLLSQGQNGRLVGLVSRLRGTTLEDERRQLREAVVKGQQTARIEQESRAGRSGVSQSINSFDRLTKALQASADGLSGLQQRAAALSDVFDGTITAARVSSQSEALDQFGRGDNGALAPLDIVSAATGELGGQLRAAGGATNSVRSSLDRVLPTVIANTGIESGDVTTEVSRGLYRDLGYGDDPTQAPQDIQRSISAVAAQLNHAQDGGRGLGGILSEVQVDASRFNDQLVSAMSDPIKEFGQRAAKQLEENANRFVDGVTTLAQRTQQVGQLYDQLAQVRAGNFRTQFQSEQEGGGRGNEGLGRASIDQLEQAFTTRQQRLAGNISFDPAAIGRQLGSVRAQVQEATERQQAAFASSGGNSAAFQQAAQEVVRLKDRAANLQQALRNLSDVTARSAVIQEKLNRLKQEEDGRLGIAERFATAGYEERARINQGFTLANQAANRGTLDGFGADQQRQIVEALRSAGGVTLTGFNGSPRADDLLRNLLGNSFGGAFRLTGDQQRERAGLQGQLAQRGATAEQALSELIKHQEDANQKFFDNLRQQQTQFFAQLSALLLRNRLGDVENQIAGATVRQRELQEGGGRARDLLARVGVTTTDQLTALRGRRGDLDEYRNLLAERTHRVSTIDAATAGLSGRTFGDVRYAASGQGLADYLTGAGFDSGAVGRVTERARALAGEREARVARTRLGEQFRGAPDQLAAAHENLNRGIIRQALREEKYGGSGLVADSNRRITEVRGRLAGIAGVNVDAIGQVLGGPDTDQRDFLEAVRTAFTGPGNRLEDFGGKLRTVTEELDKLRGEAERLRAGLRPNEAPSSSALGAALGVAAVTRANGGSIFEARGTDTVPAMLTPGEYVVNAASARANMALLHRVNTARGPVQYRQTGGAIVRAGSQNAPSASSVANGYLWAVDKIKQGMGWLGFASGGRVPSAADRARRNVENLHNMTTELTDIPHLIADELASERRREEAAVARERASGGPSISPPRDIARQDRRPSAPRQPITDAQYEARRNPGGRTAQAQAEQAAIAATQARQSAASARHERDREQYERDRLFISGLDEQRRAGNSPRTYSVIGGNLSGAALAGAETSAANAEDHIRRRMSRFHDRDVARLRRNPEEDAAKQRRAADTAAGNLAAGAALQVFNRASHAANSRVRRPGDEGQRNIALRNLALQQGDISQRFATDPALQRFLGAQRFAAGGPVHGAGVGDTVPSLLTNGEFVLNQNATARMGKHNLQRFNSGGPVGHVSYLANGGAVTSAAVGGGELKLSTESERAMTTLGAAFNQFVQQVGGFTNAAQSLSQTFNVFAGHAQALSQALSSFPRVLSGQFTHQVTVVHNGAEVFAKMTPFVEQVVTEKVNAALSRAFKDAMPDAGVTIN